MIRYVVRCFLLIVPDVVVKKYSVDVSSGVSEGVADLSLR